MKGKLVVVLMATVVSLNAAAQCVYPWIQDISSFLKYNHLVAKDKVTVAVVDTGFDILHEAFSTNLWTNQGEIPSDGIDNDLNGYIDDVHGWNFLGNSSGEDIESNGTAEYREFKRLRPFYRDADTTEFNERQMMEYRHYLRMADLAHIPSLFKYEQNLRKQVEELEKNPGEMKDYLPYFQEKLKDISSKTAQLDYDDDVHRKIGNDPEDFDNMRYGNNHICTNPEHGTMVAGIVSMIASNCGADVSLMLLRAVPDRGDEYDRDVAASIIYAVDNGADIINLSLGKYFSRHQDKLASAIRYAAEHNVLIVQAAGNDGTDNDTRPIFPGPYKNGGGRFDNVLVIGSCDRDGNRAGFSNFGERSVDFMAPGIGIESSTPGGKYGNGNGTSLSAPIVSAVAAVMKSYNPQLPAERIAEILRGTAKGRVLDATKAVKTVIGPFIDWEKVKRFSSDSLYKRARNTYTSFKWSKPGKRDIAIWSTETEDGDTQYRYFIPNIHKKPRSLFTDSHISSLLKARDSSLIVGKSRFRANPEFKSEDIVCFVCAGQSFEYSISKAEITSQTPVPKRKYAYYGNVSQGKKWSLDSMYCIYSVNHNIHLAGKNGEDLSLSDDGELYHSFSMSGTRPENDFSKPGYAVGSWISGTHSYFAIREDSRKVGTMSVINSLAEPRPEVSTYKYALPGDTDVAQYECYVINADSKSVIKVKIDKWKDQKLITPKYRDIKTTSDAAWLLRVNRTLDSLELCKVDAATGRLNIIISEECKPHYNETLFDYHILSDGKEILWWSERDGKGAWYLYSGDGRLKNRICGGDFVAGQIVRIDTSGRSLICCGYGYRKDANPEYEFYFRSSFNGKKTVCLTPENGQHAINFSESGQYLSDTYSRIDQAPQTKIYDLNGRELAVANVSDLSKLYEWGWKEPDLVKVKAADGITDLWGVVYLPADREPERRYPIISHVYPGPQTDLLPKAFAFDDDGNHSMAQMGCVVINFMHRGCNPWMGREFSNYGYGNLRDYPLEDDRAVIRQLAEKYNCIDTTRVGIFGHSGGGFMAATAIMTYPDFYKVAVAASGNYDNNIYSIRWGELYHGVSADSTGVFVSDIPTTQQLASRLKGKLLLITGDVDKNVNPAATIRLAGALIKARKHFDMLVIPGVDHELGNAYYENAIRCYFLNHLLGVKTEYTDITEHK